MCVCVLGAWSIFHLFSFLKIVWCCAAAVCWCFSSSLRSSSSSRLNWIWNAIFALLWLWLCMDAVSVEIQNQKMKNGEPMNVQAEKQKRDTQRKRKNKLKMEILVLGEFALLSPIYVVFFSVFVLRQSPQYLSLYTHITSHIRPWPYTECNWFTLFCISFLSLSVLSGSPILSCSLSFARRWLVYPKAEHLEKIIYELVGWLKRFSISFVHLLVSLSVSSMHRHTHTRRRHI